MSTPTKPSKLQKARENARDRVMFCFCFTSDWLRERRGFFFEYLKQSKAMIDVKRKLHVKVLFFFVVAFISFYIVISNVCQWLRAQIIIKKKKRKRKKKKRTTGTFVDDLSSETYCKHIIIPPSFQITVSETRRIIELPISG